MIDKNCLFCKIVSKKVRAQIIEETNNFIAILDANPKAEGHSLILPKKHHATFLDIPSNLAEEMCKIIRKVSMKLLEEKKGDGFNLIMNNLSPAGQAIMHAHIHVIPRKEGDGLRMIS